MTNVSQKLKKVSMSNIFINWIISFLENRYVSVEENFIKTTTRTFGGYPPESCMGPLLCLLIAVVAFQKQRIQAFADDFILILI